MITLPTEIVHKIFSFLPRSSLLSCIYVNQLWHDCSLAFLYENVHVSLPEKLGALLTTLTNTHNVDGGLGEYVKSLSIGIKLCDLPMATLPKLLLLCSNIEMISINHPHNFGGNRPQITLDYALLLPSCTKLRTLHCYGDAVNVIAKCSVRQITTLLLHTRLSFAAIDGIGYNFPNLTTLVLDIPKIKVAILQDLAINCPNLDKLDLTGGVQGPIPNSESMKITTSSLSTLHFSINNLDSSWVAHLALRYPKLKRISTRAHHSHEIIDFCEFAQSCSFLSDFSCKAALNGYAPTAHFFEMLSRSTAVNKGLEALYLKKTLSFGDQDLRKAAICFGQTLRSLTLLYCHQITSDGLIAALGACHNLTYLSLSMEMAIELPQLMSHCSRLETLALEKIEITCPPSSSRMSMQTHLKRVQLSYMQTWPVVLDYISAYCSSVSHIELDGFYTPNLEDTCILNLPNHHIHTLIIDWFLLGKFTKKCQYLIKFTEGFKSGMLPRTRWSLCQYLCEQNCLKDDCDGEWSNNFIEPKDAVSKTVNLEICIGRLDNYRWGPPQTYEWEFW